MEDLKTSIAMMNEGIDRTSQLIPTLPAAEAKLNRLMLMVASTVEEVIELELKSHKLIHSEFLTLMFLYGRPDSSSTPGELCEYAKQGATNMTRIGNALVKRGLVTRGNSEQDRRRVVIRITAAGRRLVLKLLPPLFPHLDAMFAGFTDTDKKQLDRLLRKLAENLDQLKPDRA